MNEETRLRVFEPFFSTKEAAQGTGLGLATVYGIVRRADGHIALESAPGRGTRFEILFPVLDEGNPRAITATVRPQLVRGRGRVLLVEAEAAARRLARVSLEEAGYEVLCAPDAERGVALIGDGGVDLLIAGLVMPGVSGPELWERLNAAIPGLPVLFLTGHLDRELHRAGAGDHPIFHKPFTPVRLASRVRDVLDSHRAVLRRTST